MDYKLRNWELTDAVDLARNANNARIAENLRNTFPNPYTSGDAEQYIRYCRRPDTGALNWCIEAEGQAAGSIGVIFKDDVNCKCAELGYWLAEQFWGRGIMTAAVKEFSQFIFENYDIVRIYAEVFDSNVASQRVLEKAGFQKEAVLRRSIFKNGTIKDAYVYALVQG